MNRHVMAQPWTPIASIQFSPWLLTMHMSTPTCRYLNHKATVIEVSFSFFFVYDGLVSQWCFVSFVMFQHFSYHCAHVVRVNFPCKLNEIPSFEDWFFLKRFSGWYLSKAVPMLICDSLHTIAFCGSPNVDLPLVWLHQQIGRINHRVL